MKKIFTGLFLLFFSVSLVSFLITPQKAIAAYAITLDSATTSSGENTVTWNHTIGNNANRVLLVSLDGGGHAAPAVTYNGISMQRPSQTGAICSTNPKCDYYIFYLLNPPVGTFPVKITGTGQIVAGAVSYYNVDQTTPFFPTTVPRQTCANSICNVAIQANTNQLLLNFASIILNTGTIVSPPSGETSLFSKTYNGSEGNQAAVGASMQGNGGLTGGNPWITNPGNGWTDFLTLWAFGLNLAPVQTYTISGNVFNDANKNGIKDTGESNYASAPVITASQGTVVTKADGSYTISGLTAGTVTVSLNSVPSGYGMTEPVNGPPPTFQVTVGPGCSTNGSKGASCQ